MFDSKIDVGEDITEGQVVVMAGNIRETFLPTGGKFFLLVGTPGNFKV